MQRLRPFVSSTLILLIAALPALAPHRARAQDTDAAPDKPPTSGLLDEADAIAAEVARLRGLALTSPLDKNVSTRAELRAYLTEKLVEEYSEQEVADEGALYTALGLLDAQDDYTQLLLDLHTEQIAGFYDPDRDKLHIIEGIPRPLQRITMAHEIFHALQDQHFDIDALQAPFPAKHYSDFQIARAALLEGDAYLTSIDFTLYDDGALPRDGMTTAADSPKVRRDAAALTLGASPREDATAQTAAPTAMQDAPLFIREFLMFPYVAGVRFVVEAYARTGSWAKVQTIYRDAPVSSEQILHPERYFTRDDPILLDFDPRGALGAAWTPIYDNVWGELGLHLMLKQHLHDDPKALSDLGDLSLTEATAGWDGDRILAMRHKETADIAIVHVSVWDTVEDARQYWRALDAMMHVRTRKDTAQMARAAGEHGRAHCWTVGAGAQAERIYVEQWGDLVIHIEGLPSMPVTEGTPRDELIYQVREATADTLTRRDFRAVYNKRLAASQAPE